VFINKNLIFKEASVNKYKLLQQYVENKHLILLIIASNYSCPQLQLLCESKDVFYDKINLMLASVDQLSTTLVM